MYRCHIYIPWFIELVYSPLIMHTGLWLIYWFIVPENISEIIYLISFSSIAFVNVNLLIEFICAIYDKYNSNQELTSVSGRYSLTIIIPAYLPNEHVIIMDTITHLLNLPDYEIVKYKILVAFNGGDMVDYKEIFGQIKNKLSDEPGYIFVKESTTKAQNINTALNYVYTEYVMILDADHWPYQGSIIRAMNRMMNDSNIDILQGMCAIDEERGSNYILSRLIKTEFTEIYAIGHIGGMHLRNFAIFGGSNGFWKTSILRELCFDPKRLVEDVDSSFRALILGYKIVFDPKIVSFEEPPPNFLSLYRQRTRWSTGWSELIEHLPRFLISKHLSIRQKFFGILVLFFRELYYYLALNCLPIGTIGIIRHPNINILFYIFISITILYVVFPIAKLCTLSYLLADSPALPSITDRLIYIILYIPYELLKTSLGHIGHMRLLLGNTRWQVTNRNLRVSWSDYPKLPEGSPRYGYPLSPRRNIDTNVNIDTNTNIVEI